MKMSVIGILAVLLTATLQASGYTTGQFTLDQGSDPSAIRAAGGVSFTVNVQNMPFSNSPNTSPYFPAVYLDCDDPAGVNVIDDWAVAYPGGPFNYTAHWPYYGLYPLSGVPEAIHCVATLFFTREQPTNKYQKKILSPGNTLATLSFNVAAQ